MTELATVICVGSLIISIYYLCILRKYRKEKMELRSENQLQEITIDLLKVQNKHYKEQNEKMRNCYNCKKGKSSGICKLPFGECINNNEWEIKE